jgi:soluble lytic murein transglycosylase-like protein
MVKRPQKTLARTLSLSSAFSQWILIFLLFAPALVAFHEFAPKQEAAIIVDVSPEMEDVEPPRPPELVKIFDVVKTHRPDLEDAEAWRVSEVILEESAKRHLDPMMVLAVIRVESGFQYTAVSPMGARGIMQIMPETGRVLTETLHHEYGLHPHSYRPESLDDPLFNIRLGVYYLHNLTRQFRSLNLALIAYNAGPAEIQNCLEKNIAFSDQYATLVLDAYHDLKNHKPPAF